MDMVMGVNPKVRTIHSWATEHGRDRTEKYTLMGPPSRYRMPFLLAMVQLILPRPAPMQVQSQIMESLGRS